MYKYFEPNTVAILNEPVVPAKLVEKPALEKVEIPQAQKACLDKNQRQQDVYYKEYNVYQYKRKDWDKCNRVDAKLRE